MPLQLDISVGHRYHDNLQLVRVGTECQQQGENIVHTCGELVNLRNPAMLQSDMGIPGSVSMITRRFGAIALSETRPDWELARRLYQPYYLKLRYLPSHTRRVP